MPRRLRAQVEALRSATVAAEFRPGPSVDAEVLTVVAQTCRDEERLRFGYVTRDGERSDRTVEPHRLVSVGRRWYLVAYDLTRFDWRSFRLDRLTEPQPTGARFRPRQLPAEDAADFVRASVGALAPVSIEVEAIVRASPERVEALIGRWAVPEAVGDGRTRIRMTAESLDWALFALGVVDAPIDTVTPPELAERMRDWGERFLRAAAVSGVETPIA